MTKTVTIGTRITAELEQDVVTLAALLNRPKSWIIEQALQHYVANEKQFVEAVMEGIAAADKGDVSPHEEVMARLEKRIQERLKPCD